MNDFLQKISKWLALNKLSLNTEKTVYIEFGSQCDSTPKNLNININGIKHKRVEGTKYLGIVFDSNMRWNEHIEYVYNKTKYLIFIFYKLTKIMSTDCLRIVYYAFFHSIISYGMIGWGGTYSNSINMHKRLQIRLLKIVNKNKFFTDKNPMYLDQIFAYESLSYHYNELQLIYLTSNKTTRNKSIQISKRLKTISIKNSFVRALMIFNRLHKELKTITSISSAGCKNAVSRRPVEERPISAPDSRTTYLKRDFCFFQIL